MFFEAIYFFISDLPKNIHFGKVSLEMKKTSYCL